MITTKVVRTLQIFVQTRTCLFLLNGLATIKTSITISPCRVGGALCKTQEYLPEGSLWDPISVTPVALRRYPLQAG